MDKKIKILNGYSGIGGNRKLWDFDNVQVTAIEINQDIANIYSSFYPEDIVLIEDAHEYVLNHYHEYDIIWLSPPCQTHSSMRQNIAVRYRGTQPVYPDMKLWQEIIFMQHNHKGLFVIENVKPYYKTLIEPTAVLQRHYFWANFNIQKKEFTNDKLRSAQIKDLENHLDINLDKFSLPNKRQILRNCIYPPLGKHIMECALNKPNKTKNTEQLSLFKQG